MCSEEANRDRLQLVSNKTTQASLGAPLPIFRNVANTQGGL